MDLLWITRDFKQFLAWGISDVIVSISSIFAMALLAERFSGIGVWSTPQIEFMLGFSVVNRALLEVFFGFNIAFISRRIGRGQLDHVLIQPQPMWMTLLTEGFSPFFGSLTLLPGVALLVWSFLHLHLKLTFSWACLLVLLQGSALVISLAFQFIWGSIAFWAPRAAEEISSSTMNLMQTLKSYPLEGLGVGMTVTLLSVLPVGFLGWFPCRALLGIDKSPGALWGTPLAAVIASALTLLIFGKGMQRYGRTGSQRYTNQGHRS